MIQLNALHAIAVALLLLSFQTTFAETDDIVISNLDAKDHGPVTFTVANVAIIMALQNLASVVGSRKPLLGRGN